MHTDMCVLLLAGSCAYVVRGKESEGESIGNNTHLHGVCSVLLLAGSLFCYYVIGRESSGKRERESERVRERSGERDR
jgi:hypothetical protein